MTDRLLMSIQNAISTRISGWRSSIAAATTAPPINMEPVSPMNIFAGCTL